IINGNIVVEKGIHKNMAKGIVIRA
ncbi:MAG: hypothetical protein K0R31_1484, partial [Clostridiales bacterium]|nr:hypothetical protein [Clostridiales bacterium]